MFFLSVLPCVPITFALMYWIVSSSCLNEYSFTGPHHQVADIVPEKRTAVKFKSDKGLLIFSVGGCQISCICTFSSLVPSFTSIAHNGFPYTIAYEY